MQEAQDERPMWNAGNLVERWKLGFYHVWEHPLQSFLEEWDATLDDGL